MTARDYESAPASETLGLRHVVLQLVADLDAVRAGTISPQDGLARAALAKQIFNGVRLYLQASRFLESAAKEPVAIGSDVARARE